MTDQLDRLTTALADRYTIEEELGAGGMATVYLAHDIRHDRKVAVKVLRPELGAILGGDRFLSEIRVTANLQHPNILPLFDSGEADGFLYYVMPVVEGESLRDKLNREKQLSIEDAVEVSKAVANALDYAHRHEVIHRDIKPENILLQDGQALVADFGIALAVTAAGGNRLTETGLSLGTPQYMSPEQAMGDREIDARSDVYSLGTVLYEMLAGDPPYIGSTAQAIVAKVITEKPQPVTNHRDTVPANVAATLVKALAKLPADRFATAAQFVDALTNPSFAGDATTQALAAAAGAPHGLRAKLTQLGWPVAAVLAAVALWGWLRPDPAVRVGRFRLPLPEDRAAVSFAGTTFVPSPDGTRFVYVGAGQEGRQLYLRPLDQLEATPIPGTQGQGAYAPFFSPDGASVGFFLTGGRMQKISLAGGPPITVTDSAARAGADWGPDGRIYFTLAETFGIASISQDGGPISTITTPAESGIAHLQPHVLPNGRGALFVASRTRSERRDDDVAVVDLGTGQVKILVRGTYAKYATSGHLVYVVADGTVMAAPFDPDALELTGPGVALLKDVTLGLFGGAELSLSNTGVLVYRAGGGGRQLAIVSRDGVERVLPTEPRPFDDVGISPDGTRIAVGIGDDLWIYSTRDNTLTPITFEGVEEFPLWTPDGTRLAFPSTRDGKRGFYWKPWDGSGLTEPLFERESTVYGGAWSPDGEWLVFSEQGEGERDLSYIRLDGSSEPQPIGNPRFNEGAPALSPDGRWLAYESDETGRLDVFVRPFPGPGGRFRVSTAGGREPTWAIDGREVFYRTSEGMIAAEITLEPTPSVGERRVLFNDAAYQRSGNHREYDVLPDGSGFVMIKQNLGDQDPIIVLNWFEELKERVGR